MGWLVCLTTSFPGRPWKSKKVKSLNYAKKETPMSSYSRFLTSDCRPHSHANMKGKSGTVRDDEDIEPLLKFLGETKATFQRDVLPSLALVTP